MFDGLVHLQNELNDVKFTYLLTSLMDGPKELLKGLPIMNGNYSVALTHLHSRHDDQERLP